MAAGSRVGICLDESLRRRLAGILRELRAPGLPAITDFRELGLDGVTDEVLLAELGKQKFAALVTFDSAMLSASVRRNVWRLSGVSVFMTEGKWGNLLLFEKARRLIWWWPAIIDQARSGPQGGAWRLSAEMVPSGMQQVLAESDGAS